LSSNFQFKFGVHTLLSKQHDDLNVIKVQFHSLNTEYSVIFITWILYKD